MSTDFGEMVTAAQSLHQQGHYEDAAEVWQSAQHYAPDELERARAQRGESVTLFRWVELNPRVGDGVSALELGRSALSTHQQFWEERPEDYRTVREVPESLRVVSRMSLLLALRAERAGSGVQAGTLNDALEDMRTGDSAVDWLDQASPHVPDQHVVNWWPTRTAVESFAPDGNRDLAKSQATSARKTARFSESSQLPTAANISPEYTATASSMARWRARAATAIAHLATPQPSLGRSTALRIATTRRVI